MHQFYVPLFFFADVPSPIALEKDAGFCSGGEDDESEESNRSNSDDSGLKMGRAVAQKLGKNKRKCGEPLRLVCKDEYPSAPLKKRIRFDPDLEAEASRSSCDREPDNWDVLIERVPPHPAVTSTVPSEKKAFFSVDALLAKSSQPTRSEPSLPPPPAPPREQRNYKNMTRERRIEANARERTRVHTISAAFETLRKSIPAYSHNQKLSKLSVLRIACSYILALSKVATGEDDEPEENQDSGEPTLSECVESVSKTIQTEGKLRKRRDDV